MRQAKMQKGPGARNLVGKVSRFRALPLHAGSGYGAQFEGGRSSSSSLVLVRTLLALGLVTSLLLPSSISAADTPPDGEVGLRVLPEPLPLFEPGSSNNEGSHVHDGWLILNPRTRRGYQIFKLNKTFPLRTAIWSFDLDTLQPLRRAVIINFLPLGAGHPTAQGDVVHAVDEEGGRIFLAGMSGNDITLNNPQEMQVAVIDEKKLDGGPSLPATVPESGFVTRRLPIPPSQRAPILTTWQGFNLPSIGGTLRGMAFSRASGEPRLLLLFGTVQESSGVNSHWLTQWDPERAGTEYGDWIVRLAACERAYLVANQGWQHQLEILRGRLSISIGCSTPSGAQAVRFPLFGVDGQPNPKGIPNETVFDVFPIPRQLANVLADPQSERLLFQVQLNGTTWWAFDTKAGSWVGGAGEMLNSGFEPGAGIDPASGRLYSLTPNHNRFDTGQAVQGGFSFSDTRLTPIPQMTNALPSLAHFGQYRIWVDPETPERARRVFVRRGSFLNSEVEAIYLVIEDTIPVPPDPPLDDLDVNTINVPEVSGITGAKFDVGGSGFGFRTLLIGGIQSIISRDLGLGSACYANDREIVIGQVERAMLSNLNASVSSISLSADQATKSDLESPSSRCAPFNVSLPSSQAIDSAAGQRWDSNGDGKDDYTAQCSGDDGKVDAPTPQKVEGTYSSWAECNYSGSIASGFSSARLSGGAANPVSVLGATSEVTTRRLEDGGSIVEVEAIARGIEIAGVGTIGVVRTVAEARSAGVPKSAVSSFDRFICGVDMPGFKVTSCLTDAQEEQFVDGLNRLLVRMSGKARMRQPDSALYPDGTPGGYLAAVQRNRMEALDDKLVIRDSSEAVPGLEIIFYRGDSQTQGSGRQVFQFAAVQASSAYGIFCLFGEIKSEDSGATCVRPTSELKVSLSDDFEESPTPLPGGVFEVHVDTDGDGLIGVDDQVLELGDEKAICTTALDGTGDCVFQVPPGKYVVHQFKAPDGFAPAPDCYVSLPAFASMTCEFVNSPRIGLIYVGLTDDSVDANPLSGGVFELYVDDGDEQIGKGDKKLASCTTDLFGDCIFKLSDIQGAAVPIYCTASALESEDALDLVQIECIFDNETGGNILAVELGKFIVHQAEAPPDYQPASDQIIDLKKPWDRGIALFVNGLKAIEGTAPIEIAGTVGRQSSVVIEEGSSQPRAPSVRSQTKARPEAPSVVTRILNAPAEAINFLLRHPKEAMMFGFMWMLLVSPIWLTWRRRSISSLGGAGG